MPVPNRGAEAVALAKLSVIANALIKLVPEIGASSDMGKDVLKAAQSLLKHVPPGTVSPGIENSAMMNMQRAQAQQQPMAAMMANRGQPAAPPPAQPPAAP